MKKLIALLLLSQSAFALEYNPAKSAMFLACQARSEIASVAPECNALIKRMQSGHLVSENEFNSWCSMAQDRLSTMKHWEAEYKTATKGKKLDYSKCPKEALAGN
jgi:hypothetical protein